MVSRGDAFLLPTDGTAFGVILAVHPERGTASVRFQNGFVGRVPLGDLPAFQSCLLAIAKEVPTPRLKEISA
jgi:hypothetical protein